MINFGTIDTTGPQLRVVRQWMEGYHSLDMTKVEAFASKDFMYHCAFNRPEEARADHFSRYAKVLASMKELNTTVIEAIESPGKVVIRVTNDCTTIGGETKEKEAVCIVSLVEEDGELKVLSAKEFADPQKGERWDACVV